MTTHLTDTQRQTIRIALATCRGWRRVQNEDDIWEHPNIPFAIFHIEQLPNYPASLDACHEIIKKLSFSDRINYHNALRDIRSENLPAGGQVVYRECIDAEAEERAIALYLSLNLGELGD